ncbi:ZIP family metal transporter [Desulfotomaculum copahuensis]|uniref:Divalent cation transporter n=1 Tax=Desulfotomaculum copahuensis TaxID=1838280 RepID=A0A1B7LFR9_9FIRM|nr:ZIP family metal transporter [Desulfotomaculum copahuensis]OAT82947.1 divalent cation transporter [Desulfotomaculum copahuensis]
MGTVVLLALLAGLGTLAGAVLVLLCGRPGRRLFALFLGLAAGVMIAVVLVDLLPAAWRQGNPGQVLLGFSGGVLIMSALDMAGAVKADELRHRYLKIGYLIAAGIALHDLPEGLAIAAGFEGPARLGPLLVAAIALHNIPEGMATAAPLAAGGMRPAGVLAVNALVSLLTPLGCWLGLLFLHAGAASLSLLLAMAAGAMVYIIAVKLLPESHLLHRRTARAGLFAGLVLMIALNLLL